MKMKRPVPESTAGGNSDQSAFMSHHTNTTSEASTRLLITPGEAALALSVSPRKLWSLTNAGQIPCVRLGRCMRYSPADLQDWIDGQRRSAR